ncbi:GNAT family N-acetyltransferase [Lysinibacillus parviboronicapiens]|uniref:Ribosomal protein S18 acetylase RimI-like enzyme n=1 Tax=Lysinibacillus parviboronicapiens TaxID=436516 RepID=A0ABV2PGF8_9BACI|nr:GNAT family N-acetyltransferase [Lysinibacillus parviboronicapiens]
MEIKTVSQCTLEDVLKAWNKGFEGYFVQITMDEEMFLNRLVGEGLSPKLSLVAFDGNEPVGIVLNGVRHLNGRKTSWNGGTGISSDYRGTGISRALMEETLAVYARESVEIATLEAITGNSKAIALYEKYGYRIANRLLFLSGEFKTKVTEPIQMQIETLHPEQLSNLSFYQQEVPWQCSWHSNKQGQAKVFYNLENEAVGYMLYRSQWAKDGQLERLVLYQLEVLGQGSVDYIPYFLDSITNQPVKIATVNFLASNPVTNYLLENGLEVTTEQVQMKKIMNE